MDTGALSLRLAREVFAEHDAELKGVSEALREKMTQDALKQILDGPFSKKLQGAASPRDRASAYDQAISAAKKMKPQLIKDYVTKDGSHAFNICVMYQESDENIETQWIRVKTNETIASLVMRVKSLKPDLDYEMMDFVWNGTPLYIEEFQKVKIEEFVPVKEVL